MYGLVNKAIQDLVIKGHGIDKWTEIKNMAGMEDERFVSLKSYPDKLTYDLVGAASRVLGADANKILEAFGEHWVLYTAEEGYGDMLDFTGSTLVQFLKNLDLLHLRVKNMMPHLQPPKFECIEIAENEIELHYYSEREGFAPMVIGLLNGLGKRFKTELQVEHIEKKQVNGGADRFLVRW
ncbi:MAG: heme NO-binding domain-containing protein [Flavobacteriales bacterium]|nr:heme NO-binding domain-containing protein [Flavobacteriales bacterium]